MRRPAIRSGTAPGRPRAVGATHRSTRTEGSPSTLAYEGITARDFPVIQAVMLVTAAIVTVVNLGVDRLYALIDPRIRVAR